MVSPHDSGQERFERTATERENRDERRDSNENDPNFHVAPNRELARLAHVAVDHTRSIALWCFEVLGERIATAPSRSFAGTYLSRRFDARAMPCADHGRRQ